MKLKWTEEEERYFEKNADEKEKMTALENAFEAQAWSVVDWIVARGVNPQNSYGYMVWDAVKGQDLGLLKKLISYNCNVRLIEDVAFRDAVKLKSLEMAKVLKEAGADPKAVNSTAMTLAAENNDVAMIKQLAEWGVSYFGWQNEPLISAVGKGAMDAAKLLVEMGANFEDEKEFYMPIRYTLCEDNEDMGKFVLKHTKNIEEVMTRLETFDAYLPENWKIKLDKWRLSMTIA